VNVLEICLGNYKSWKQIPKVKFSLFHFNKNRKEIQSDCLLLIYYRQYKTKALSKCFLS